MSGRFGLLNSLVTVGVMKCLLQDCIFVGQLLGVLA